mmetsp:Transcript_6870/g.8523  ORF Transcript_6870/g.8523 Transcript_6870/m.8523 type:complete len:161 (+) Transcript_6870:61-543(+)
MSGLRDFSAPAPRPHLAKPTASLRTGASTTVHPNYVFWRNKMELRSMDERPHPSLPHPDINSEYIHSGHWGAVGPINPQLSTIGLLRGYELASQATYDQCKNDAQRIGALQTLPPHILRAAEVRKKLIVDPIPIMHHCGNTMKIYSRECTAEGGNMRGKG